MKWYLKGPDPSVSGLYIHIYAYTHTNIYIYTHTHMCVYIYVYMCVFIYIFVCVSSFCVPPCFLIPGELHLRLAAGERSRGALAAGAEVWDLEAEAGEEVMSASGARASSVPFMLRWQRAPESARKWRNGGGGHRMPRKQL